MLFSSIIQPILVSAVLLCSICFYATEKVMEDLSAHLSAQQPLIAPTISPSISSTMCPVFHNEISPQFNTNTKSFINAVGIQVSDITVLCTNFLKETVTADNYNLLKTLIKQLLWESRYKIAGGALLGSYSTMSLLLLMDYYTMHRTMFWARWKEQLSFEDLCGIPQIELSRELMLTIGKHHFNKSNPTDLAYPLITFIKEIDNEITTIKRYIMTTKIIKKLRVVWLFPTNDAKIAQANKMLERALFIKHIFLSWLADYNLAMTQKITIETQ
jgi:hypothetical protein